MIEQDLSSSEFGATARLSRGSSHVTCVTFSYNAFRTEGENLAKWQLFRLPNLVTHVTTLIRIWMKFCVRHVKK